ncbi:MAG TPA: histidine phosphatase family protein [Clostridiaceae bacterium]|nr:histidine phosphatase family protein [Clostridiaceae bacterium]
MLLYYIRHGDPIYDPDSLTPLGHRQAESVAKRLALFGVDKVYASTSNRAIQTAQPTCEMLKKEAILLDFANEKYAWQEFSVEADGMRTWIFRPRKYRRLFASPNIRKLGDTWYEHPDLSPYKDNFKMGLERISRETDNFLLSLGYERIPEDGIYRVVKPNEERIALFAHEGFGYLFISYILNIPYPIFTIHFEMCHSGMTVIEFPSQDNELCIPKVLTYSNNGHLYHDNLPLDFNHRIKF